MGAFRVAAAAALEVAPASAVPLGWPGTLTVAGSAKEAADIPEGLGTRDAQRMLNLNRIRTVIRVLGTINLYDFMHVSSGICGTGVRV